MTFAFHITWTSHDIGTSCFKVHISTSTHNHFLFTQIFYSSPQLQYIDHLHSTWQATKSTLLPAMVSMVMPSNFCARVDCLERMPLSQEPPGMFTLRDNRPFSPSEPLSMMLLVLGHFRCWSESPSPPFGGASLSTIRIRLFTFSDCF